MKGDLLHSLPKGRNGRGSLFEMREFVLIFFNATQSLYGLLIGGTSTGK
jgi:hypothetical protein